MDDNNPSLLPRNINSSPNTYALNGKILLCSVIILCVAVIIITCFRSYFLRRRRRHLRRSNNLLNPATAATTTSAAVSPQGLDLTILKSLPTFIYSATTTNKPSLECAVCLSEFEENETGRLLPKCNHAFHIDCIDRWFNSHSNCPLCRVPVQSNIPVDKPEPPGSEIAVESSSGLCGASEKEESEVGSSSHPLPVDCRKRPLELAGIIVEVPTMEQRSLEGMSLGSPQGHGYKSPGNRILTMKRLWSI